VALLGLALAIAPALPASAAIGWTLAPTVTESQLATNATTFHVSGTCLEDSPIAGETLVSGTVSISYDRVDGTFATLSASGTVDILLDGTSPDWSATVTIDYSEIGAPSVGEYLGVRAECYQPGSPDPDPLSLISGAAYVPFVATPYVSSAPAPVGPASIPFDGSTFFTTISGTCSDEGSSSPFVSLPDAQVVVHATLMDASLSTVVDGPSTSIINLDGSSASWTTSVVHPIATAAGQVLVFQYSCTGTSGDESVILNSGTTEIPVVAAQGSGSGSGAGSGAGSGSAARPGDPGDPDALAETGPADVLTLSVLGGVGGLLVGAGAALVALGRRRTAA
jgi:hypothetical protein